MGNTPNGNINNTLLVGPIDTEQEVKLILDLLQKSSHLRRYAFNKEIHYFLEVLKQNRIEGPVDTVREIEILLDMMRQSNMLMGPIDTPEEIKLFMENLYSQGYLPQSLAKPNPLPRHPMPKDSNREGRKRKRIDTDEELDDDDDNPDTPPRPE